MERKESLVLDKLISSLGKIEGSHYYAVTQDQDEYYFQYPENIFWSIMKSDEEFMLFLYVDYAGTMEHLIGAFDDPSGDQPKFFRFDKRSEIENCSSKLSAIYESMKTKSNPDIDRIFERILKS